MQRRELRVKRRAEILNAALGRFVEVAQGFEDVRAVYVFGSLARGDVGPESDLDLLVVRDTSLRRAERDLDLRRAFDVPIGIDLVVVTPEEFVTGLPSTAIGRTILADARLAYAG